MVLRLDGGAVCQVRIALTNVGPTGLRAADAEAALLGHALDEAHISAATAAAIALCDPADDLRGDRAYKTAMAGQMLRRSLAKAAARC